MVHVAAVIVGTNELGFRRILANEERLALARAIAEHTRKGVADVVVLPAGFLAVETAEGVAPMAATLAAIFDGVGLVAGIDELDEDRTGGRRRRRSKSSPAHSDDDELDGDGLDDENIEHRHDDGGAPGEPSAGYHYWAFAADRGRLIGGPWWQRTARSGEIAADTDAHVATFDGTRVGILLCGELYNPALAQSLAAAQVHVVVDLGHRSMTRITRSLERIARTTESTVLHVQHVAVGSYGAAKWRATPAELAPAHDHAWASYDSAGWKPGSMWAEVKVWTL
jgi:predicted amidohydrolase